MKHRIFLHIGLHKTATKYLQHFVFPYICSRDIIYNPPLLTQYVMDYLKADDEDKTPIYEALCEEKANILNDNPHAIVLISKEIMAGDLFTGYADWKKSLSNLYTIMPDAHILIALRFQYDWLVSCYRESLHEHHYQTADKFLCYNRKENAFTKPRTRSNKDGYAHMYAFQLDYAKMLQNLFDLYGKQSVTVFFYEHFKEDKDNVIAGLLEKLGVSDHMPPMSNVIPNRGFSALAITLSIARATLLKRLRLGFWVHRPIFFFGKNSIPAGNESISILPTEKYWGRYFLRDNEEVRSSNYPHLTFREKLKMELSWRYFVKNCLDKLFYWDWDVLKKRKTNIVSYYKNLNRKLLEILSENDVPSKYYE